MQLINRQHATVIDLREEKEFEGGSIVGSKNIPLGVLQEGTQALKKFEKRPIALICASGAKSRTRSEITFKGRLRGLICIIGRDSSLGAGKSSNVAFGQVGYNE